AGIALPQMNLQDYLYRLGQSPQVIYSDMNGYGPFSAPLFWFHLYWGLGAILLAMATNLFWVRGVESSFRNRMKLGFSRFSRSSVLAFAAFGVVFVGGGGDGVYK